MFSGLTSAQRPRLLVQLSYLGKHPAVPSETHHTGTWLNRVLAALMSGNSLGPQKQGQVTSPQAFFQEHPHVDALIKSSVELATKRMYPEQVHGVEEDKLPSKLCMCGVFSDRKGSSREKNVEEEAVAEIL